MNLDALLRIFYFNVYEFEVYDLFSRPQTRILRGIAVSWSFLKSKKRCGSAKIIFLLTLFRDGAKALSNLSNCAVRLSILTVRPPLIVIMTKAESSRPKRPNFMADTISLTLEKQIQYHQEWLLSLGLETYRKQSTTCLSLKRMICRFSRATAVSWTLLEGMSTGSTHFILAGNFCDQRRLPLDEKLCKQSSIVPTKMVFSRRINPTAWKRKRSS